eukprot:GHVR01074593.1.p1 GENE.GHVR01074593.1~~GHVR01074593.1.p1  ORF type:complete len:198 (-),score=19.10 GHVR01074593.1:374-967(-)
MALSLGTNSYASVAEANFYFTDRMDATSWDSATDAVKAKALVSATRQIDGESFVGAAVSATQALSFPRHGMFHDQSIGFDVSLDDDFDWTGQPANEAGFPAWFRGLSRDIRYVKTAVYEQALWLISNSGVINSYSTTVSSSSGGNAKTVQVGSLEVSTTGAIASASSSTRRINPTYYKNLRPILTQGGGSRTWFRSN